MNNRSGSFNTVKRSNRTARLARRRQGRITLLAICATVLLLAVTGLVLLICNLAHSFQNPDGPKTPGDNDSGIVYTPISTPPNGVLVGDLIAVNKGHIYSFPSVRLENLPDTDKMAYDLKTYRQKIDGSIPYYINLSKGDSLLMEPVAAEALNRMLTDYYMQTKDNSLTVYDAYRTQKEQEGSGSFPPGYSEHHTGLVASLRERTPSGTYQEITERNYSWIYENAHKYGFVQRYPVSKAKITLVSDYPECFRYVGVPHATYMKANDLCLEEYLTLLKNNHVSAIGTDGKHLPVDVNGDGKYDYEIYYIPAAGTDALVTLYVPSSHRYTVSGDNIGGFIITVDLNSTQQSPA